MPIGEAPDEPAHLAYVSYLLERHALPPLAAQPYGDRYESYQAPLDYLAMAAAASVLGVRIEGDRLQPNPRFSFSRQEARAVLSGVDQAPWRERVRRLRMARLLWAALTAALVLATAYRLAGRRLDLALAATLPFVLSPQFLFVSATLNNDGAVVTLAALALLGFVELLDSPSPALALLAGFAAGLAPWGKVSGFLLAVPLVLVAFALVKRRRRREAFLLAGAWAILVALWICLSEWRFGVPFPPSPTGVQDGLAQGARLLNPHWLGSLWMSFWGKFGWFNVTLPLPAYLFFALPTALVAIGCVRRMAEPTSRWRWLCASTLGANFLLIVVFLLRIDWQPQGRFLFPSLPAMAGCGALGLRSLAADPRWGRYAGRGAVAFLCASALGMALLGLLVIRHAYS
ncbi:MAG TPA: glycosyltransferase family 39 protein [Thermoanaerobaculia bacterium]